MDKDQALYSFWSGFNLPAYDETDVPDDAQFPYITYAVITDKWDSVVNLTASLWYYSTKWSDISQKKEEIAQYIGDGKVIKLDNGYLWLVQGSPFAQRMADETDTNIRRIYLNIQAEFLTAY